MNYQIKSFQVDHDFIVPGMYLSRVDGDVLTFDLRTRKPNCGDYMDNITMHSVEHMFATYARFSEAGSQVVYFGPMGCRTGFYLLVRDMTCNDALELVKATLQKIIDHQGEVFGNTRKECGNYKELDLEKAKIECRKYLKALENWNNFEYVGEEK
ncbi:MAG: S-ribosylhomocysteine lyase [Clostridia bacterium]|nr:S-ribosylhomocysteine lyase [Clostridia bacterium]